MAERIKYCKDCKYYIKPYDVQERHYNCMLKKIYVARKSRVCGKGKK